MAENPTDIDEYLATIPDDKREALEVTVQTCGNLSS